MIFPSSQMLASIPFMCDCLYICVPPACSLMGLFASLLAEGHCNRSIGGEKSTSVMFTRRLLMLYSLYRPVHCSSSRQARSTAFILAFQHQQRAATTPAAAAAATLATRAIADNSGRSKICVLPSVLAEAGRGARSMSSDSALFGGRRGGRGGMGGRGRGGRRSPDYGPPRAGQQR